jgi:hypothetical protein
MFVSTIGFALLLVRVHVGGCGVGGGCQLTVSETSALLPAALVAAMVYTLAPAAAAASVQDEVVEVQPAFHVKVVGLLVHDAVTVMVCPSCGEALLDDSEHTGTCGAGLTQVTPEE